PFQDNRTWDERFWAPFNATAELRWKGAGLAGVRSEQNVKAIAKKDLIEGPQWAAGGLTKVPGLIGLGCRTYVGVSSAHGMVSGVKDISENGLNFWNGLQVAAGIYGTHQSMKSFGIAPQNSFNMGANVKFSKPWDKNSFLKGKLPMPGSRGNARRIADRLEVELVQKTGKGTFSWTRQEIEYIKRTCEIPKGVVGHHTNNAASFPDWEGDPRNISYVRGQKGNFDAHGRNFQNPTTGPLIDRDALLKKAMQGE
ncbi:MAG: hypothetical protein AAB276_09410, partial [Pseudomonadota bacterium]